MVRLRTLVVLVVASSVLTAGTALAAASWYWIGGRYRLPSYNMKAALEDILTQHRNDMMAGGAALQAQIDALNVRVTANEGNIAGNTAAITNHVNNFTTAHNYDARFIRHAETSLRSIRGLVRGNGAITLGSGFTVTKSGVGLYRVNFNAPFADSPTLQFTSTDGRHLQVWGSSPGIITLTIQNALGIPVDGDFFFLATGR